MLNKHFVRVHMKIDSVSSFQYLEVIVIYVQGLFSSGPEMVSHALAHEHVHSHSGHHHHGIDMDHPILALNMTIVSICIKEGYFYYLILTCTRVRRS